MTEWLEALDRSIVLGVNAWHTPWLDEVMWFISGRAVWIPFYLWLLYLAFRAFGFRKALGFLLLALLTVAVADLVSVHLIKNLVERYRPSHHQLLTHRLHFYEIKPGEFYKGGQYGFVSSHAANFFALSVFVGMAMKRKYKWLLPLLLTVSVIVCFSRLYLGVHYLSDLIGGAIVGSLVAYTFWKTWWKN